MTRLPLLLCFVLAVSGVGSAGPSLPDWALDVALFVNGGPPARPIDVRLNGRPVGTIDAFAPTRLEVAEHLVPGPNTVEFTVNHDAEPSAEAKRTAISLAYFTRRGDTYVLRDTIAEVSFVTTPDSPCTETFVFWAGPAPTRERKLRKSYLLFINGPPIGYRIVTRINGTPIHTAVTGDEVVELTTWLDRGKNIVEFFAEPSCLLESAAATAGKLKFLLAGGFDREGEFEFDRAPLGTVDMDPPGDGAPFRHERVIRAR